MLQATCQAPATSPRKISVSILNPVPGGNRSTSLRNAERFVRRGVARWVGHRLEFIDRDSKERAFIAAELARIRAQVGYDSVDRAMTLKELAAIPFTRPEKLIIDRSRGRSKRARN